MFSKVYLYVYRKKKTNKNINSKRVSNNSYLVSFIYTYTL